MNTKNTIKETFRNISITEKATDHGDQLSEGLPPNSRILMRDGSKAVQKLKKQYDNLAVMIAQKTVRQMHFENINDPDVAFAIACEDENVYGNGAKDRRVRNEARQILSQHDIDVSENVAISIDNTLRRYRR